MNEDKQEQLVKELVEFLRPHADGEVEVDWQMDTVPVAYISFDMEGVKYNLSVAEDY